MENNEELRKTLNDQIDNLTDNTLKEVSGGAGEYDYKDYSSCPVCGSENIVELEHSQRDGWIHNKCCNCGHKWTVLVNQIIW